MSRAQLLRLFLLGSLLLVEMARLSPRAVALPSPTPDRTWQVNGEVRAIARYHNIIYMGGAFTQLREKPVGVSGGQVIRVRNLAAIDASTGGPVAGLHLARVTGTDAIVHSLEVWRGKLFIGGWFTGVDGHPRRNLAAVDAATGNRERFRPRSVQVWTINGKDQRLYVGGDFGIVNRKRRVRLAAFQTDGSLSREWRPSANDRVRDIGFAGDGTMFVLGRFTRVAGSGGEWRARKGVARFDAMTGALKSWVLACLCTKTVIGLAVRVSGDRVYLGMGGSDWVGAYELGSGRQIWRTDTNGQVQDVALMGDRLVIGGHFRYVAPGPGGYNCYSSPGTCYHRLRLAALGLGGRLDLDWAPAVTGYYQGVWDLRVAKTRLYVGGRFDAISGVKQSYFARLS